MAYYERTINSPAPYTYICTIQRLYYRLMPPSIAIQYRIGGIFRLPWICFNFPCICLPLLLRGISNTKKMVILQAGNQEIPYIIRNHAKRLISCEYRHTFHHFSCLPIIPIKIKIKIKMFFKQFYFDFFLQTNYRCKKSNELSFLFIQTALNSVPTVI